MAGAVGVRRGVRDAEPGWRPLGGLRGGAGPPEAVRARYVPVPVGGGAARGAPARVHRDGHLRAVQADDGPARAAHDGLRRVRAPGRAVRGADGDAPAGAHGGEHREHAPAAPASRSRARPAAVGGDDGRVVLPVDAVGLLADLPRVVRHGGGPGAADLGAGRGVRVGGAGAGEPREPDGRAVGVAERCGAAGGGGQLPAGVPRGGAGELVPGARDGARQRRGDGGGPERARELPGLQASAQAVDDADHGVRAAAARRPGRRGLAGTREADAAELDRAQRGGAGRFPGDDNGRFERDDPRLHDARRTRSSGRRTWCWRRSTRWWIG